MQLLGEILFYNEKLIVGDLYILKNGCIYFRVIIEVLYNLGYLMDYILRFFVFGKSMIEIF